jgi:hypothetical protein
MALLCAALFLCGCFSLSPTQHQSSTGGTGTEILGKAEYPDTTGLTKRLAPGSLSAKAALPVILGKVFVYPKTYLPDTSWFRLGAPPRVYTNDSGGFRIMDAPRGPIIIEVNDGSGKGTSKEWNVAQDSTTYDVGTLTVAPTGSISIQATTSLPGRVRFYVAVCGTRLVVRGDQAGINITMGDVPAGTGYVINVRVYEPVYLEFNVSNVNVSAGLNTILQSFTIQ